MTNKTSKNKPELLAPAGTLDILKIALMYGADAVYCGTPDFAMRARVGFTLSDLEKGIKFAHKLDKKVYVTINAFPHPEDIEMAEKHIEAIVDLKPDALIVADPGLVSYIHANFDIPIHLSTQASTTNHLAAKFWQEQGAERIVLARELSLAEITFIHNKLPDLEIETFVHGAMCMAYSGRCQISNYMTGRDPNQGQCVQACRFKYKTYALEEQMRPDEYFPIIEDEEGTHILNSKDLCMIEFIPELIKTGAISLKIEGRLKSEYYVAAVVRAYRKAIDAVYADKYDKKMITELKAEIEKTASRGFTTGFYFAKPDQNTNNYTTSRAESTWGYIGRVISYDNEAKMLTFEAKNYLPINSTLEIMTPDKTISYINEKMFVKGKSTDLVHANTIVEIPLETEVPKDSLIRIKL